MGLEVKEEGKSDLFEQAIKQVEENTATHLYPLWMQNWAENFGVARYGSSLDVLYRRGPVEKVMVVGRGPSLFKYKHLETVKEKGFDGSIVAADGALPVMAKVGVIPGLSMTVDGSHLIAKWYRGEFSSRIADHVGAILPVTVHPSTRIACQQNGFKIYWYIPELESEKVKGLTDMLQLQTYSTENTTGLSRLNGAGNSGLAAIVLAGVILRAKEIVLIGMDGGYPPDTPLKDLHYHDTILQSCGFNDEQVAKLYKIYDVPVWNQQCIVDPVFEIYRKTFGSLAQQLKGQGVKIVNATEGGCLATQDVECMKLSDYYAGRWREASLRSENLPSSQPGP